MNLRNNVNDIQEVPTLENKIESTSVQSEAQGSAGDIGAKDTEESVKSDPVETTGTAYEPSETAEKGGEEVQTEPVKGDVESSENPAEEGDKKGESGKSAEEGDKKGESGKSTEEGDKKGESGKSAEKKVIQIFFSNFIFCENEFKCERFCKIFVD